VSLPRARYDKDAISVGEQFLPMSLDTQNVYSKELPSPLSDSLKDERDVIDQKIVHLHDEMQRSELRRLRNMKTLINLKLPCEILSNIFSLTKDSYRGDPHCFDEGSRYKSLSTHWIRCTSHVCSHWRAVALSDPSLWVDGIPANRAAIKVFLERSKDLPIVLDSNIIYIASHRAKIYSFIPRHMKRVEALYIEHISLAADDGATIAKVLDTDMPHLKELCLSFNLIRRASKREPFFTVPHSIIKGIKYLRLNACNLHWDQAQLRNLTVLRLSSGYVPFARKFRASIKQISNILRLSPELQSLELENIVLDDTGEQNDTYPDIFLPSLMDLSLRSDGSILAEILINNASAPRLTCMMFDICTNSELVLTSLMATAARAVPCPSVLELTQSRRQDEEKRINCFFQDDSLSKRINIINSWHGERFNILQIIPMCLQGLDLRAVSSFLCSLDEPLSKQWWTEMLKQMPSLKQIDASSLESSDGLISALTPEVTQSKSASDKDNPDDRDEMVTAESHGNGASTYGQTILSPSLASLILHDTLLDTDRRRFEASALEERLFKERLFKDLIHCLSGRMAYGCKLNLLSLLQDYEQHVPGRHENMSLRECVNYLDFDGEKYRRYW
jgi:hypothetical protein